MDAPPTDDPPSLREPFIADHRRLEELLGHALETFEAAAHDRIAIVWHEFRDMLARHMHAEESTVIPALVGVEPREVRVLLEEHRHIRSRCRELTAAIDRRVLRPAAVRAFVEELRAHAAHEDSGLYRWAEGAIDPSTHAQAIASLHGPPPRGSVPL